MSSFGTLLLLTGGVFALGTLLAALSAALTFDALRALWRRFWR